MYGNLMVAVQLCQHRFLYITFLTDIAAVKMKGSPDMVFVKKSRQTDIKKLSVIIAHSQCASYPAGK